MKRSTLTRVLSALLTLAVLLGALPMAFAEQEARAVNGTADKFVVSQTEYVLADGVTETEVLLNTESGDNQVAGFLMVASADARVTFKASYHGYYSAGSTPQSRAEAAKNLTWGLERTTDQARSYEAATGEKVIFATNGDYYNMQTAQPLGYLVMEGNVVQTGNGSAQEPYFAVLKDGSFVVRDYGTPTDDVAEAISGPFFLVKDGVNVMDKANTDMMPRNSIGLKADGSVVTFLADGRQAPYSVGMTLWEQAEFLAANGVVDAIYLDGGGSATFATVREGTEFIEVRNSPSDGPERTVSSALLMVSTAVSDGSFDHASIYPKNEVYTPGSTVPFSALGVDAAGKPAEVPTGLTWSVPAEQGTITNEGVFTAKAGYIGDVEVTLRKGSTVYGSTKIKIADIDELYFTGESISMDFDADSDLGLTAKSAKRGIHYKVGDFTWEIKSATEGVADEAVGSMNGNLFHSGSAEGTLNALVQVSYQPTTGEKLTASIRVEIGKLPIVMMDFEPDENGPLTGAHFHWGKADFHYEGSPYGPGYVGEVPEMTVITANTYSPDGPTYTTLTAPYAFTGNYDTPVPAAPIFHENGYTFYLWPNNSIKDYCAGAVTTTSRDNGAQVRSGEYALELNYDYSSFDNSSNSNFYMRYCGEQIDIEGYPTEVGVWVYAPEGTPGYSLRGDIALWNGAGYSTKNLEFKHMGVNGELTSNIDWTGWMYCYADLTAFHSQISAEHPAKIRQGEGFLWLCYIPAAGEGRFNGTLYFDDYRFVYGTNLDDLINPVIDTITVNGAAIAEDGSTVLSTGDVELAATFHDPESQNSRGVDASATAFFLDGVAIAVDGDGNAATTRTTLGNGHHTIRVQVTDFGGNTVELTREFEVKEAGKTNASVSFGGNGVVTLGGNYVMDLTANGKITELEMTVVDINTDFGTPTTTAGGAVYGAPVVTFAEGVEGSYEFTPVGYKKGRLTLKATCAAGMTGTIASVSFAIPADVDPEVDFFKYRTTNISFTDSDGNTGTDAYGYVVLPVTAYYTVQIGTMLAGRSCVITVLDVENKPAFGVTVFLNGTEIGLTGEDGTLTTDAMKELPELSEFVITASSTLGLSFEAKGTVFGYAGNGDALPTGIQHLAVEDASTTQTITWLANAAFAQQKAYIRYMTEETYEKITRGEGPDTNYLTIRGESELVEYPISKSASLYNTVTLEELTPGTTYYYWLGDGRDGNWSERRSFTTQAETAPETTKFYVLGDTQMLGIPEQDAEAIAVLSAMLESIGQKGVDFGLQTGDFVDNGGTYAHYQEILDVFQNSAVADKPVIHVLGNHEYYGDLSGNVVNQIFQIPGRDYYSVEINNVYLAVINNSADIEAAAAWLVEDAAASDCTWKIASIHEPAYYTNASAGTLKYQQKLTPAFDEAGIDVVFSGHDHSYARTEQLTDGKVVEDGTTYFICGDLGEKSRNLNYAAVDNPDFHFAHVTQEYSAIYLLAEAGEKTLTINVYDANGDVLLDSFTKSLKEETPVVPEPPIVEPDPPVVTHNYVYIRATGQLICSDEDCDELAPRDYSGWAKDYTSGKDMYFIGGRYVTGWTNVGDETYHFDTLTGEKHTFKRVDKVPTTCTERGYTNIECECGETYFFKDSNPTGHVNEKKETTDGVYYVCKNCGRISLFDLSFADVADTDWFAPNISYVIENELFSGRSAVEFDPNTSMSRIELVSVIWRLAGKPDFSNTSKPPFTDCAAGQWYTAALNWASSNGIVNGVGDGLFEPDEFVTREQIVTIFYRYARFADMDTSERADYTKFFDYKLVSEYAEEAMSWAVGAGMIQGDEKLMIHPQDNATRAEVATMVMRLHKLILAQETEAVKP